MQFFSKTKTLEEAKILYKKLALENHPDKGGETSVMQEINAEFEMVFSFLKHSNKIVDNNETSENFTRHFYTENGWEGSRYDRNLRTKDISKIMREYVKSVYPTWKFSICMDYNSIYISVVEAPMDIFTLEGHENEKRNYHQINHYYIDNDSYITDYCKIVLKDVYSMLNSYNYDDSDSIIDYFNTNFYMNMSIGKWDKPFRIVEKIARIQKTEVNNYKRIEA